MLLVEQIFPPPTTADQASRLCDLPELITSRNQHVHCLYKCLGLTQHQKYVEIYICLRYINNICNILQHITATVKSKIITKVGDMLQLWPYSFHLVEETVEHRR